MSTKQYLMNASARHQVFIQRYAGSTYKQMAYFLEKLKKETTSLVSSASTTWSRARYNAMLRELTSLQKAIYKDMEKSVKAQMSELAAYEAGFTQRLVEQATIIPTPKGASAPSFNFVSPTTEQLQSAAFTSILDKRPGLGRNSAITIGDALSEFGIKKTADIVESVRVGFALGKPTNEIARDISNIMNTIVPRQAKTLARTITNHVAAESRNTFYRANQDIITGYQVVATLDDRTTFTCAALDGQVFPVDAFDQPPYHWNCRTTFIGVVKPEYDIKAELGGTRPAKGLDGVEQVSTQTTYNSWLKAQPSSFQDEILGPNRGKLFRAGMPVQKFVDANYQSLTIDELRTKDNAHIFDKVNI